MRRTVTATEANRSFSKLLREVQQGARVGITSHGRTIAELRPFEDEEDAGAARQRRIEALETLKKRWAGRKRTTIGPWTREELYERD